MVRGTTLLGTAMLCVVGLAALAAPSAFAEGQTAYICEKVGAGKGNYSDPNCGLEEKKGAYDTVAVKPETTTIAATLTEDVSELKFTSAGVKVAVVCNSIVNMGGDFNSELIVTLMKVVGFATQRYTECVAELPSSGKTCTVKQGGIEGTFNMQLLKWETMMEGTDHVISYAPNTGTLIASFTIEGCSKAVDGLKEVRGSMSGVIPPTTRSHIVFTGSVGGQLKVNGGAAEYEGMYYVVRKENNEEVTLSFETS